MVGRSLAGRLLSTPRRPKSSASFRWTRFEASLARQATRRVPFAAILAALLAAGPLLVPAVSQAQLPTLGDTSEITSATERKLGERIARELYRDPDYIEDPVLDEYVQDIWKRLLAAARTRGELSAELDERFAWQVLLGKDRSINAFALPGGWLGLHLGLISATATQDELASVLAHELSHVTQRHISRLMTQQSRATPWVIGAMILGAMAASKSPDAGNAVIAGGQALAIQNQLNFSRDMEREADRIGFGVMTQAGFEAQGFVTMFDKLQQAARLNDNGNFPYLRTHPMNTERIADMQARQQLAGRPAAPAAPDLVHAMMAGRARVLSNPGVDALRSYLTEAQASQRPRAPGRRPVCRGAGKRQAARCRRRRQVRGQARRADRGGRTGGPLVDIARRRTRAGCRRHCAGSCPGRHVRSGSARTDSVVAGANRQRQGGGCGAAFADMGGPASARCPGLATAGGRLQGAGTVIARHPRRSRGAGGAPGLPGRDGPVQGGAGHGAKGRTGRPATTSRLPSSTPAPGRWSHFFANRLSSADSITRPISE